MEHPHVFFYSSSYLMTLMYLFYVCDNCIGIGVGIGLGDFLKYGVLEVRCREGVHHVWCLGYVSWMLRWRVEGDLGETRAGSIWQCSEHVRPEEK